MVDPPQPGYDNGLFDEFNGLINKEDNNDSWRLLPDLTPVDVFIK